MKLIIEIELLEGDEEKALMTGYGIIQWLRWCVDKQASPAIRGEACVPGSYAVVRDYKITKGGII
jgi:hypothetical protein